jgi:hypothetical protein
MPEQFGVASRRLEDHLVVAVHHLIAQQLPAHIDDYFSILVFLPSCNLARGVAQLQRFAFPELALLFRYIQLTTCCTIIIDRQFIEHVSRDQLADDDIAVGVEYLNLLCRQGVSQGVFQGKEGAVGKVCQMALNSGRQ